MRGYCLKPRGQQRSQPVRSPQWTISEAASFLGVSEEELLALIRRRGSNPPRPANVTSRSRRNYYDSRELRSWFQAQQGGGK